MASEEARRAVRLEYRELSVGEASAVLEIKAAAAELWDSMNQLGKSRELSLAKTHLEESVMWAVKHITG